MNNHQKIAIGTDHAGFEMKEMLKTFISEKGYEVEDFGTHSSASMDYPDVAHDLSKAIENEEDILGILICGSGNGVAMAANKHANIRAGIAWMPELAELARTHNHANILVLPARFISEHLAEQMVMAFLEATPADGRHERRVNKINCI